MKKLLTLMLVCLSILACSESISDPDTSKELTPTVSYKLSPSWSMTDIGGKEHNFPESAQGKTTVLLFWATWCPYCKRLLPHLQSALYQYAEDLDLEILSFSIFEDGNPAEYLKENGYDFTLFTEAEEIAKLYDIKGTPGVLIIDAKGQIRFDLRDVPSIMMKPLGKKHWQKAMQSAPYWGSEFRKALESLKSK